MIHRGRPATIDVPDLTLTEYVLGREPTDGDDRVALVDADRTERITYAELGADVAAVAGGLAALGVRPGDVVALISHNQPVYAVAVHGIVAAGAAVTPINPAFTAAEIAKVLRASGASVVIAAVPAAAAVAEAADAAGVAHRFALGEHPGFRPFAELRGCGLAAPRIEVDPATAVAALPFSSGTTGLPKGVRLTHRNLVANLEQNRVGWPVGADEVLPASLPFFHIYGFTIILNTGLAARATVVTLARFALDDYLRMLQEHRATRAFLAPPVVLQLATAPAVDDYDLSSVRLAVCGAAPLDVAVAERAEQRVGWPIRQGYGMTEASPGTHQVAEDEFATTPAGSVGRLLAGTDGRLVDPATGEDAAPGEPGELWVRGPQVMPGYLDDPGATAATLVDGWLRTGDIARVDDDGVFWIVDRLKELIKYKGYQVPPAELEALLLTHPDVLDAAVVGVPHAEGGEAPKAFVVAARPVGAEALMDWVAERVAPYKKVRAVEFVERIPKSPTGKILRRELR
ncbi:AMP-binding protein [Pseudonocardia humida]|uniref:AMP-binding protein n=1 Tax=Pseudonocardia humida TaxID=2800819 RepID=A0ABT1ADI4_9PSEU|nr:AMP-binding protein [Pseudonocardia humida]MCO1660966.1 AMP-binding protein [Pseudonocardia humida]